MYYPIEKQEDDMVWYMHYAPQSTSQSIVICATSTRPISTIRDGIRQTRKGERCGEEEGEEEEGECPLISINNKKKKTRSDNQIKQTTAKAKNWTGYVGVFLFFSLFIHAGLVLPNGIGLNGHARTLTLAGYGIRH